MTSVKLQVNRRRAKVELITHFLHTNARNSRTDKIQDITTNSKSSNRNSRTLTSNWNERLTIGTNNDKELHEFACITDHTILACYPKLVQVFDFRERIVG
ncbi:hypothetical protein KC19_11G156800 [Ceratodon purpureus]|uniref:Uncharacterized protein n=1 Tax=Ceratodon purpureus TaxID=3225 RepID=A0A8T0GHZ8_CERPU|nr:hypothetical protein KC19_11G156800 [Ceratodon purpureus]